jgi:Spy/CpxP family protein refolding chaperone
MNIFKKYSLLVWGIAFVGIVVISAVTTFLIFNSGLLSKTDPIKEQKPVISLQTELSLTPEQNTKVDKINSTYNTTTEPTIVAIRDKKLELLDELSRENTDTQAIKRIAEDLSIEQKKLQRANIDQFLELKKVCNTEQTKKLSQIYSELYGCQGKGKGKGKGQGMGHRHRWGQQRNNAEAK